MVGVMFRLWRNDVAYANDVLLTQMMCLPLANVNVAQPTFGRSDILTSSIRYICLRKCDILQAVRYVCFANVNVARFACDLYE